jgi:bacillithiol system protein YtxJ
MITWKNLDNLKQLDTIVERSKTVPCLLFKHSTTCEISAIAKKRLEQKWDFSTAEIEPYYLDLKVFRAISNEIAEKFGVYHESPQVLLIRDGECVYDASHLDISVAELHSIYTE